MGEKLNRIITSKFGDKLRAFYTSVWHVLVFGLICVFCHVFEMTILACVLFTILLVPAFIFCKNLLILVPFMTMCSFALTENTNPETGYYNTPVRIATLIMLLVILLAALLFNLIYYKNIKLLFKKAYLTASLCLATSALMLGGITEHTFTLMGVATAIAIGATMFLPYSVVVNCVDYEKEKTIKLFAWTLVVVSVIIGCAVLKSYYIHNFDTTSVHPKEYLKFGFAISNSAAAYVVIALPLTFYLVYKYKYGFLLMAVVALEIFIIVMNYSRSSLVVALPGSVIVTIALMFKKKRGRLGYLITCGILIAAAVAIVVSMKDKAYDALFESFNGSSFDSGRFKIWWLGFERWQDSPVFGVGLWFLPSTGHDYTSFHCTPLTYLYCAGIVGLAAYIYHRYKTVRLVFSVKLTSERVFLALSIFAMLLNALLDVAMTSAPHLIFYAIMLGYIELDAKKTRADAIAAAEESAAAPEITESEQLPQTEVNVSASE
ncbi:MAG: O-antigen ligase family protein [Clostridiales bacterium]|nr:O-antigen ligase family protein [Clostridiales bacterium]